MRKLCQPESEAELAVMRSLLEGEKINFFVHNDHFGSLLVGPRIDLYNMKTIMVAEDHYDSAAAILNCFLGTTKGGRASPGRRYSLMDKIRMVFEVLCFAWIIPGRMRKKREKRAG